MKTHTAAALFFVGLIMAMFGVGGVENSIETRDLLAGLAVAVAGLGLMFAGTSAMQVSEYYDHN
jgi:hypothetical protein